MSTPNLVYLALVLAAFATFVFVVGGVSTFIRLTDRQAARLKASDGRPGDAKP